MYRRRLDNGYTGYRTNTLLPQGKDRVPHGE